MHTPSDFDPKKPSDYVQGFGDDIHTITPEHQGPPEKWLSILDRVDQEVTGILHVRQIWDEFRGAVGASHIHGKQPLFSRWVSQLYAHTQAIAIRRMVDDDKRSGSFVELLRRMAGNPEELTRQWYIGGSDLPMAWSLDTTFNSFANPQAPDVLDPDVPRQDVAKLKDLAAMVGEYATKNIAHADLRPSSIPTFRDISEVIDELERLLVKYTLILEKSDRIAGPPIIQYPWKGVFYEAWLPGPYGPEQERSHPQRPDSKR